MTTDWVAGKEPADYSEMDVAGELVHSQVDTPSPALQSIWKRCDGNDCV
jgi:hypothetical protein